MFFSPSRPNREHARNLGKDFRVCFAGMSENGLLDARCASLDYILMDFCEFFISLFRSISSAAKRAFHARMMNSWTRLIYLSALPALRLPSKLCKHRDMSSIRRPHQLIFNFYALQPLRLIKRLIMLRTFLGHFLNCFP